MFTDEQKGSKRPKSFKEKNKLRKDKRDRTLTYLDFNVFYDQYLPIETDSDKIKQYLALKLTRLSL